MTKLDDMYAEQLTAKQKELKEKHGTPAKFAAAVYEAVPGYISMDEAKAAVDKYNAEWYEAGVPIPKP